MRRLLFVQLVLIIVMVTVSCAPMASVKRTKSRHKPKAKIVKVEGAKLAGGLIEEDEMQKPAVETKHQEVKARAQASTRLEGKGKEKQIILNFENADISTVIETIGDILDLNYILAPGISGQVTIQSNSKFPVSELFSVFQAVLEMNNLTAVKEGPFYTILPIDQAKGLPLLVENGKDVEMTLDSSFITHIITVEHVKASDAASILRNLLPRGADLIVYEPTNILIVTARPSALSRVMKILEAVDIEETETEAVRTFVYYVEHGEAKSLTKILKTIYTEGKSSGIRRSSIASRKRTTAQKRNIKKDSSVTPSTTTTISSEVSGEVILSAYDDINAIIIKATPKNYLTIVDALKKLDIPRKQVLIDVMVAEVTLSENEEYGVEWLLKTDSNPRIETGGMSFGQVGLTETDAANATNFALGAVASVFNSDKFNAILNMFASNNQLKVIASPSILATDNKEARIEVGDDVPTATGNLSVDNSTRATLGQIQYRTTGTILEVTPYINAKNMVTLKISQEISSMKSENVGGLDSPVFNSRKAKTTAIVQDGNTLVIGGLIDEKITTSQGGIPYLSQIPVIGFLFGSTKDKVVRTELLIMVTPHIITYPEDAKAITDEYKNRVRLINERLEQTKKRDEKRGKK